jgi:type IV secretory pathway VirJ component
VTSIVLAGCALNPHHASGVHEQKVSATLHGKTLELHLAAASDAAAQQPLVLYASGDGGWFGAAVDMFDAIAHDGYNVVGFSARTFLRLERPDGRLSNPEQLASEYDTILAETRTALHLSSDTPIVLSGWSRGAAFAILVATARNAPSHLRGVVSIGLTDGEDLQVSEADDSDDAGVAGSSHRSRFQPYARIGRLGDIRCAVIQATGDHFLPAARAHELFGADTPFRHFYAVTARNHRFSGGRTAFESALADALHWAGSTQ